MIPILCAVIGMSVGAVLARPTRAQLSPSRRDHMLASPLVLAVTTGIVAGFAGWHHGLTSELLVASGLAVVGMPLTVIDILDKRLPRGLIYAGILLGLGGAVVAALLETSTGPLLRGLAGAAMAGGMWLAMALLSPVDSVGAGDVRLNALLGLVLAWHGWSTLLAGLMIGAILQAAVFGTLLMTGRADHRSQLPAGPAAILGALVAILVT